MYGYKIKFNSLPDVVWACETTVKNYAWKNGADENMIEISVSEFPTKTRITNGKTYTIKNNELSCLAGNDDIQCFCDPDSPISITSVAVRFSDYEYIKGEFSESDYTDNSVILLPSFIEKPPLSLNIFAVKALHNMIQYNTAPSEASKKAFTAEFFNLLYKIDEFVRSTHKENKKNYYIEKTNYLINKYYPQKITLGSIAKELNLSTVYLSKIYKESTGITFSEQLLNVRMYNAEKMLINRNRPTAKIAEMCGFCDESHFRKTFKKFFNVNIRDYRNIKNGVTLYHEKPVREDV